MYRFLLLTLSLYHSLSLNASLQNKTPLNKLLEQHKIYFLPFSLYFQPHPSNKNLILPFQKKQNGWQLLPYDKYENLYQKIQNFIKEQSKASFIEKNLPQADPTRSLSQTIFVHKLPILTSPIWYLPPMQKIQIKKRLQNKPKTLQITFKRLQFLKSLIPPQPSIKNHLFIIGPHWCRITRQYQILIESYIKLFKLKNIALHALVFKDKKEIFFDSPIIRILFPHPLQYSHIASPRFLTLLIPKQPKKLPKILEEAESLKWLYQNYLKPYKGFFEKKQKRKITASPTSPPSTPFED